MHGPSWCPVQCATIPSHHLTSVNRLFIQSPESQFKVSEIFTEFPVQWHLLWCIQWGHCLIDLLCAYVRFCYGYPNASSSTEEAKSYQNIHPQGDEGDEAVLTREQTFIFQTWSPYCLYHNIREPWAAWRSPNWAVFIQLRRGKEKWKWNWCCWTLTLGDVQCMQGNTGIWFNVQIKKIF